MRSVDRPNTPAAGLKTGSHRTRTDRNSRLKVGYNRVFGYYLEISNASRDVVPENYIRKQTLVGAERYITPELKEYEAIVLNARERMAELEHALFRQVCAQMPRIVNGSSKPPKPSPTRMSSRRSPRSRHRTNTFDPARRESNNPGYWRSHPVVESCGRTFLILRTTSTSLEKMPRLSC